MLAELKGIGSEDEAATWAHKVITAKNELTTANSWRVEEAFRAKLASFGKDQTQANGVTAPSRPALEKTVRRRRSQGIDKSALPIQEPRRIRDKEHLRFVAQQPCLVCGRSPSDPHHLRFTQRRALGRKVSDEFTVPLCRGHHREVHRSGDEKAWWKMIAINPMKTAREFWRQTRMESGLRPKRPVLTRAENPSVTDDHS